MPSTPLAGPYRTLTLPEGGTFPYYVIPFDKDGRCEGPQTREHLLANLDGVTDVFLFSHGWNNDWKAATTRYEDFIRGFQTLRTTHALPMPVNYRPLLVGIFWPSQSLTWFESETGPGFAGGDPEAAAKEVAELQQVVRDIATELPVAERERFFALATATSLNEGEDRELAAMLARALSNTSESEAGSVAAPAADDLLTAGASLEQPEPDYDAVGTVSETTTSADPNAAGVFGSVARVLDPRNIVKPFTVYQMKDRAGKIGAHGVGPLLARLLNDSKARVHLLGHSYGCKVVMTATCTIPDAARQVESALLLQPAISQYAFSENVPERGVPGGFAPAIQRVHQPIMATFSEHDTALHDAFHLSVRRHDDLGELQYAGEETPSRFGALGGYGPQATKAATIVSIRNPKAEYTLPPAPAMIGLQSSRVIGGHGDILNESVWWACYTLCTAHMRT